MTTTTTAPTTLADQLVAEYQEQQRAREARAAAEIERELEQIREAQTYTLNKALHYRLGLSPDDAHLEFDAQRRQMLMRVYGIEHLRFTGTVVGRPSQRYLYAELDINEPDESDPAYELWREHPANADLLDLMEKLGDSRIESREDLGAVIDAVNAYLEAHDGEIEIITDPAPEPKADRWIAEVRTVADLIDAIENAFYNPGRHAYNLAIDIPLPSGAAIMHNGATDTREDLLADLRSLEESTLLERIHRAEFEIAALRDDFNAAF